MKRSILASLLALLMLISILTGCTQKPSTTGAKEKIIIQLNSSQSENTVPVIAAKRVKEIVEAELGKDRIEIQIFPDGQLGKDTAVIDGMRMGTHDALIVATPITTIDSMFSIFDLPYIVTSREEVEVITKSELGEKLNASLLENGFVNVAFWNGGFRQITNNERPVIKPEDLKGLKIRVPASASRLALLQSLGANPTSLSFGELFSALQQGVVDGQENPITVLSANSFAEVQKYLSMTNHVYTMYYVIFPVSKWESYPKDVQDALRSAFTTVQDETWSIEEKLNADTYKAIEGKMEINEVDLEAFKAAAAFLYTTPEFVDPIGADFLDEVLAALGRK